MRYYVKIADAVEGLGFTKGYWRKSKAEEIAEGFRPEYGNAVWVVTGKEMKERLRGP